HAPVKVARHHSPFNDPQHEGEFLELLAEVLSRPEAPEDYGILPDEWEDYGEVETIRTGTNGKELVVVLPRDDWFPRAAQWAQVLDVLTRVLEDVDNG
ncbi:hypothetical protein C8R44DRAFT_649123, partial [Mycena epipterygia]